MLSHELVDIWRNVSQTLSGMVQKHDEESKNGKVQPDYFGELRYSKNTFFLGKNNRDLFQNQRLAN
jgi:hypothetical protein